jgi:hypothetical protein
VLWLVILATMAAGCRRTADRRGAAEPAAPEQPAANAQLELTVTPEEGDAPLAVVLRAELVGDVPDEERFRCPSLAWVLGNGEVLITRATNCRPGEIPRVFELGYTYGAAGSYDASARLLALDVEPSHSVPVLVRGATPTAAPAAALPGPTIIIATVGTPATPTGAETRVAVAPRTAGPTGAATAPPVATAVIEAPPAGTATSGPPPVATLRPTSPAAVGGTPPPGGPGPTAAATAVAQLPGRGATPPTAAAPVRPGPTVLTLASATRPPPPASSTAVPVRPAPATLAPATAALATARPATARASAIRPPVVLPVATTPVVPGTAPPVARVSPTPARLGRGLTPTFRQPPTRTATRRAAVAPIGPSPTPGGPEPIAPPATVPGGRPAATARPRTVRPPAVVPTGLRPLIPLATTPAAAPPGGPPEAPRVPPPGAPGQLVVPPVTEPPRPIPSPATAPRRGPTPTVGLPSGPAPSSKAAAARVMPADLYYLAGEPRQVWRIPASGGAPEQLTHAAAPVDTYAASSSGVLATVANGALELVLPGTAPRPLAPAGAAAPVWSADGRRLAYSADGVQVLDLATGRTTTVAPEGTPIAWSRDGQWLLLRLPDGGLVVVHLRTGARQRLPVVPAAAAGWLPDRDVIWLAGPGLRLVSIQGTMTVVALLPDDRPADHVFTRPDNRLLVIADLGDGASPYAIDLGGDRLEPKLVGPPIAGAELGGFAWAPDGRHAAVASAAGLRFIDPLTGAGVPLVSEPVAQPAWVLAAR